MVDIGNEATPWVPKYKLVARILIVVFWFTATYAFPLQEIIPSVYEKVLPFVLLASDGILLLLGLWTLRSRCDILLLVSLVIISYTSSRLNGIGLMTYLNGMRPYLPLVMLLPILRYMLSTRERADYFIALFDRSLYYFLLLQLPVMVIQCIRWGAYDNVGGTLGWMFSGVISTLIYVISFYLMVRRWDYGLSYLGNLRRSWMLLVLLLPSMLNETKISFVYMVFYFLFLVPMDRRFLKRLLLISPLIVIFIAGAGYIYVSLLSDDNEATAQTDIMSVQYIADYMMGDDDIQTLVLDGYLNDVMPEVNESDFARGLKFMGVSIILSGTPHAWTIGFGPGQFKGGTIMEETELVKSYGWLIKGTEITMIILVVEMGLLGVAWYLIFFGVLFKWFCKVRGREKRLAWFMGIITLITSFYMKSNMLLVFMVPSMYIIMMSSRRPLWTHVAPPSGWLLPPVSMTQSTASPPHDYDAQGTAAV